jgi:hypothetical protein
MAMAIPPGKKWTNDAIGKNFNEPSGTIIKN